MATPNEIQQLRSENAQVDRLVPRRCEKMGGEAAICFAIALGTTRSTCAHPDFHVFTKGVIGSGAGMTKIAFSALALE